MTVVPPPPGNLPGATSSTDNDPFATIEAEVNAVMNRIDRLIPPEPPPLEKKDTPPERVVPLSVEAPKAAAVVPKPVEVPKPVTPPPKPPSPLPASMMNPLKADYERRVSTSIFTPPSLTPQSPRSIFPPAPSVPVSLPKQNVVPFPMKPKAPEAGERSVPVVVAPETQTSVSPLPRKEAPVLAKEAEGSLTEKEKEYQARLKETKLAEKALEIAKMRADVAAKEVELEKLKAA